MSHLDKEKTTITKMILLYCRHKHGSRGELCKHCEEMRNYAFLRLDKCRYGNNKPTCSNCKTHCYAPEMKRQIIEIMRYSGPRMIFYHPIEAVKYIWRKIFHVNPSKKNNKI